MFFKTDFGMDVIYFVMWLLSREIMKMNYYMYYIEYTESSTISSSKHHKSNFCHWKYIAFTGKYSLPPANEIWGKVMFYTGLSVHGGEVLRRHHSPEQHFPLDSTNPHPLPPDSTTQPRTAAPWTGPPPSDEQADGTHLTRMLSYLMKFDSISWHDPDSLKSSHFCMWSAASGMKCCVCDSLECFAQNV